jgi:hypothetical protein
MDVQALLARMAAQRETWADLPGGKRVLLRRPPEIELPAMIGGIGIDQVAAHVCDWSGFTESDLLGAAGGSDAVPFHADLWRAYAADHADVLQAASAALAEVVTQYLTRKAETAKNLQPSST